MEKIVETPSGCWEWQGARTPKGYGQLRDGRTRFAHRVSYELAHGPIPAGLCVCHHCDNPPCVNPAHLFLGSVADNRDDLMRKGMAKRLAPKRPASGERNGFSKLTRESVEAIRTLAGTTTNVAIGSRFGVTGAQVGNILARRCWA